MPPPAIKSAISSGCRGYVCRSCLTHLKLSYWRVESIRIRSYGAQTLARKGGSVQDSISDEDDGKPVIRYFEEDESGRHEVEDLDEIAELTESLRSKAKAKALEVEGRRLRSFETSSKDNQKGSGTISRILERIKKIQQALDSEDGEVADDLHLDHSLTTIPPDLYPPSRRQYIDQLNNSLKRASKDISNSKINKELWRWYSLSSKTLAAAWHHVPAAFWDEIWRIFSVDNEANIDRMSHLRILAEDMKAAGVQLDYDQQLLYIEALFLDGDRKESIRLWASGEDILGAVTSSSRVYWEMGVRMFARTSQPEEAQRAADSLLKLPVEKDPRILIPLMQSWLVSGNENALANAWNAYSRLKHLLGSDMEMQDYDNVCLMLIAANRTDLALAVFTDMMSEGKLLIDEKKGQAGFQTNEVDQTMGNRLRQNAASIIPIESRNKFFFGKWIKKLIGEGEIDAAASVVELMQDCGIGPDSKHVNGIIGGWLREGTGQSQQKAESLAWKMVKMRLEFVARRDQRHSMEGVVRPVASTGNMGFVRIPASELIPRATVETFTILLEHYSQRPHSNQTNEVLKAFDAAAIQPNTSFLNEYLVSCFRTDRTRTIWATYNHYVEKRGVIPDAQTFLCLWQHMRSHLDTQSKGDLPSCRVLFAKMMQRADAFHGEDIEILRELYDQMIACFGLFDDQIGTVVALHAMQSINLHPNGETVRSTVLQLSRTGLKQTMGVRARRINLKAATTQRVAMVTKVLKDFQQHRAKELEDSGVVFNHLPENAKTRETLELLSNLLRYVMFSRSQIRGEGANVALWLSERRFDAAVIQNVVDVAAEMGVPDTVASICD